ncbi:MAG: MoaD/ThiS family protein [Thermodesulfobacteriota bacterium]
MNITVKLFAQFRKNRFNIKEMAVPEGTAVSDILDMLEIDYEKTGVIFVNGKRAGTDNILTEKDSLSVFPKIGGG